MIFYASHLVMSVSNVLLFGFYSKLQKYSPLDGAKVWDKPVSRRHGYEFSPKPVIELASKLPLPTELDEDGRLNLVQDFLDVSLNKKLWIHSSFLLNILIHLLLCFFFAFQFKGLMMSIDPTEDDDEADPNKPNLNKIPTVLAKPAGTMEGAGDANSYAVIDLDDSGDRDELQVFINFFIFIHW